MGQQTYGKNADVHTYLVRRWADANIISESGSIQMTALVLKHIENDFIVLNAAQPNR